jgi:hypothetical protein
LSATEARANGSPDAFPKHGYYDIVSEGSYGRQQTTEQLNVSDAKRFNKFILRDSSQCRDVVSSIGDGTFSVRMTCDTPEHHIRNIKVELDGTYSTTSLQMTRRMTLFGVETEQKITLTLKNQ